MFLHLHQMQTFAIIFCVNKNLLLCCFRNVIEVIFVFNPKILFSSYIADFQKYIENYKSDHHIKRKKKQNCISYYLQTLTNKIYNRLTHQTFEHTAVQRVHKQLAKNRNFECHLL